MSRSGVRFERPYVSDASFVVNAVPEVMGLITFFVLPEFGGALAAEEDSKVSGKFMDVLN
jgi:hypothetical protein